MQSRFDSGFLLTEAIFSFLIFSIFISSFYYAISGIVKINQKRILAQAETINSRLFLAKTEVQPINKPTPTNTKQNLRIINVEGIQINIIKHAEGPDYNYMRYFVD